MIKKNPPRRTAAAGFCRPVSADPVGAGRFFGHDRLTFTEEQVKAEASRCLGCGVSVVDQNKCIGCGLCTTKCMFDAIHLERDMPECSNMIRTEDKPKAILKNAAKQGVQVMKKTIVKKLN